LCAASVAVWAASVAAPGVVRAQTAVPAVAQEIESPIGKVQSVSGSVTIEHATAVVLQAKLAGGPGQAKVGDFVYRSDIIQTGADSKAGLTFTDGTAFNISSNARMELNEFVYDPKSASNLTLFSLSKGSFTFVAGNVAKTGQMKIDTPVGTMGIRGTTPHVEIMPDGTVKFSTLIEENATRVVPTAVQPGQGAPPARQRQPGSRAAHEPESDVYKKLNRKFDICRGC
jgi:hypothetical protein